MHLGILVWWQHRHVYCSFWSTEESPSGLLKRAVAPLTDVFSAPWWKLCSRDPPGRVSRSYMKSALCHSSLPQPLSSSLEGIPRRSGISTSLSAAHLGVCIWAKQRESFLIPPAKTLNARISAWWAHFTNLGPIQQCIPSTLMPHHPW